MVAVVEVAMIEEGDGFLVATVMTKEIDGVDERVRSSTTLVWASTGDGSGRWTSVPNRSIEEEEQIWFGIARLDAQAAAKEGLSWPWLPRRIRHCDCRSQRDWGLRQSTLTHPLAIESPVRFL
ncbi:hypothetical protein BHM03_00038604 [Ensete ventricosum]|nr:hypothetical protein BHM03_00038604 [Ensete ventricosum]